jgi:hypothetical protein
MTNEAMPEPPATPTEDRSIELPAQVDLDYLTLGLAQEKRLRSAEWRSFIALGAASLAIGLVGAFIHDVRQARQPRQIELRLAPEHSPPPATFQTLPPWHLGPRTEEAPTFPPRLLPDEPPREPVRGVAPDDKEA